MFKCISRRHRFILIVSQVFVVVIFAFSGRTNILVAVFTHCNSEHERRHILFVYKKNVKTVAQSGDIVDLETWI